MSVTKRKSMSQTRNIVVAILVIIMMVVVVFFSTEIVKILGSVLLFVPSKLEFINHATDDDIVLVSLADSHAIVDLEESGRFAVYTDDARLVRSTNLAQTYDSPWLDVSNYDTEESVEIEFVDRGVRPYDALSARGRPILYLSVKSIGTYEFSHSAVGSEEVISIVPYHSEEDENTKKLIIFVQLIILGLAFVLWFYFRRRKHLAQQISRRKDIDDFLERRREHSHD